MRAAQAHCRGEINEQAFAQTVHAVLSGAQGISPAGGERMTRRDEILRCAREVMRRSGLDYFTIPEVISCMEGCGSRYAESTIRTHIVSRMCANAPEHHVVTYSDLERMGRGQYRLAT